MTASMRGSMDLDGDVEKLRSFYDGWAEDYDHDVASHDYGMPDMMRRTVADAVAAIGWSDTRDSLAILDAGCGTGLVGAALHTDGWTNLRGVDLSEPMIARARERGIYQSLEGGIDLTVPVAAHLVASADVVVVGGVFTVGHVPPLALATMATLTRDGGLLVASTRTAYREDTDWDEVTQQLIASGLLELVVHHSDAPYTMDSLADYWAWRVRT